MEIGQFIALILWLNILIVIYIYFGYPLLVIIFSRIMKRPINKGKFYPRVSLIISAYNEEKDIGAKLENSLSLDYPNDKLEIIVGSDGSTDRTNEIVKRYADKGVKLNYKHPNRGKASIQNDTIPMARGEIIVLSDATGMYKKDAILRLVEPFFDSKVGCVSGRVIYANASDSSVAEGEGFYWKYEYFLRRKESEIGSLAMGSGSIVAFRKELFEPIDPAVSEDFVIPMMALEKGFRVIYEPTAISIEQVVTESQDEVRGKARTIALDIRGLLLMKQLLNPLRFPLVALGLTSHKLLRWMVPLFLLTTFVANILLLERSFYMVLFVCQIAFYCIALIGAYFQHHGKRSAKFLLIPFYFCLVNLAPVIGTIKLMTGKFKGSWQTVR